MRYLILLAFLMPLVLPAQNAPKPFEIARQLKVIIRDQHIEPRLIDDNFSADVFDSFMSELDPDKKFFTQSEISELNRFRHLLDDQLNLDRWDFLPEVIRSYGQKLTRAERIVAEISALPVDLTINVPFPALSDYPKDIPELEKRWRIILAREVMEDLSRSREERHAERVVESHERIEATSRDKVRRINLRRIRKALDHSDGLENLLTGMLFKRYLAAIDPHSVYLSATEMENFISGLSSSGYGLGLEFRENERGDLVVSGLLPGGPAWNSGQINQGDVLDKVRWTGKEWVEATGMMEHELQELIAQSNHESIEFLFRQQGGFLRNVELRKEMVSEADAVVRAFTLNGARKIGYITLPDFYSNWGGDESSKSASDVAKEIVKLKKENIDGLILDVRFNGGGSLDEAVAMTGIFIDGGPVGISRERGKEPITIKDSNRGTVYDGPLVVLVNGLSASASEFLASALQDYNRGIVVGSRTFGKGVGQQIFSLQPGKRELNPTYPGQRWGYASVTTTRMYRINGKSIQSRGVKPDIEIPDLVSLFNIRESTTPFAMKTDSVSKKTYAQPLRPMALDEVRRRSALRVEKHPAFDAVNRYRGALQKYYLTPPARIQWQHLQHRNANLTCEFMNFADHLKKRTEVYVVQSPAFDQTRMQLDQYAEDINRGWIENLLTDHILEETFHIICDYIDNLDRP